MPDFGLIGTSLSHSFSKPFFENKFQELQLRDHSYLNFEISSEREFPDLLKKNPELRGLNVTIPYKEKILPLLDELSPEAQAIGAVNCILIRNGKTKGFNTDAYGFWQSLKPFLDQHHQRALILGTGGAAKAVAYVLKEIGIPVAFATSDPAKKKEGVFLYPEINAYVMQAFKLVVNTSPLGMFPNVDDFPQLPYEHFSQEHLAYDLIYNPEETLFLKLAKEKGAITMNGLSMLKLQAEKSWEIWTK